MQYFFRHFIVTGSTPTFLTQYTLITTEYCLKNMRNGNMTKFWVIRASRKQNTIWDSLQFHVYLWRRNLNKPYFWSVSWLMWVVFWTPRNRQILLALSWAREFTSCLPGPPTIFIKTLKPAHHVHLGNIYQCIRHGKLRTPESNPP